MNRNTKSFTSYGRVVRERPLLSLFLGSFLTTSAVPVTIFSLFIMGSLAISLISLIAFQGGVIFIAGIILCGFLVLPVIVSGLFALAAYGGMSAMKRFSPSNSIIAQNPTDFWGRMVTRINTITGSTNSPSSERYHGLTRIALDTMSERDNHVIPQIHSPLRRQFDDPSNVIHFTPIVLRPRPDPTHINPITNFINRRTGSPNNAGLSFDFFASPSRTVDAHSAGANGGQENRDY